MPKLCTPQEGTGLPYDSIEPDHQQHMGPAAPRDAVLHQVTDDEKDAAHGSVEGASEGEAPEQRLSTVRTVCLTLALLLTSFITAVSASAVTLLLPDMVRSLGGTQLEMQWVSSSGHSSDTTPFCTCRI